MNPYSANNYFYKQSLKNVEPEVIEETLKLRKRKVKIQAQSFNTKNLNCNLTENSNFPQRGWFENSQTASDSTMINEHSKATTETDTFYLNKDVSRLFINYKCIP